MCAAGIDYKQGVGIFGAIVFQNSLPMCVAQTHAFRRRSCRVVSNISLCIGDSNGVNILYARRFQPDDRDAPVADFLPHRIVVMFARKIRHKVDCVLAGYFGVKQKLGKQEYLSAFVFVVQRIPQTKEGVVARQATLFGPAAASLVPPAILRSQLPAEAVPWSRCGASGAGVGLAEPVCYRMGCVSIQFFAFERMG